MCVLVACPGPEVTPDAPGSDAGLPTPDAPGSDTGLPTPDAPGSDVGLTNECLVANGGCSSDATCSDLPAGRTCTCNAGFVGDGVTCMPGSLGFSELEAYIKASNTDAEDDCWVVALSADGSTLAVGASGEDGSGTGVNPASNERAGLSGAVYVYTRAGEVWSFQAYIKASETTGADFFGRALALSGDGNTLAVGAPGEDGSGTGVNPGVNNDSFASGAVFVYGRTGSTWSFDAYIKASNTGATDSFGDSVALSTDGNTLAVGALGEDGSGTGVNPASNEDAANSGAVYVYTRGASTWSFQAYVKGSNTSPEENYGGSVALSADGNTLAVGAAFEDGSGVGVNPASDEGAGASGAVYVYSRVANAWSVQAYIKASNTGVGDQFGWDVALSADGNTLAVGARLEDGAGTGVNPTSDEGAMQSGAAYVYTRTASTWSFQAYLKANAGGAGDQFGFSVALSQDGNTLAAGAPFEDGSRTGVNPASDEGAMESGAVCVFRRASGTWSFGTLVKASNTGADDRFGRSVGLNADGTRLAVGAEQEDGSGTGVNPASDEAAMNSGAVYVYR